AGKDSKGDSSVLDSSVDANSAGDGQAEMSTRGSDADPRSGVDSDGDGLTDEQEMKGWDVWIEKYGLQLGTDTFGNIVYQYHVTSDPHKADTDGDGLSDYEEWLYKSDPNLVDSDDDGLWDGEEVHRWHTSPTSVDTDADSRGDRDLQHAPNPALFDGRE